MDNDAADKSAGYDNRTYRILFTIFRPLVFLIYPMRHRGRENVPKGAALICANHSNYVDPILVAYALGKDHTIRFMAKKQLASVPVVRRILKSLGVFFVDRESKSDIDAIRAAMRFLKSGEKVVIFPEGTRRQDDNEVEAKTGAARIAAKLGVPVLPVYIPRRKKIFGTVNMYIGKPYYITASTHQEYVAASEDIMRRIYALRDGKGCE